MSILTPFLSSNRLTHFLYRLRNRHFFFFDALLFLSIPAVALILRLEQLVPAERFRPSLVLVTLVFVAVKLLVFYLTGLYSRFWRYASIDELAQVAMASLLAVWLQIFLFFAVLRPLGLVVADFPRSIPLLDGLLTVLGVGGLRYSIRLAERLRQRSQNLPDARRVVIAGAGEAGVMILREMQRNSDLGLLPVAFIDDDAEKQGIKIQGVPIAGRRHQLVDVVRRNQAQQVVIAMPTAPGKIIREIVRACEQAKIKALIMPGIYELLDGRVSVNQLREVDIEDLLRRDAVRTDIADVRDLIQGKRVLVTGGGGSIGSELCRQILRCQPAELIILGHGENSIFAIQNEMQRLAAGPAPLAGHHSPTEIRALIADIRFPERIAHLFEQYRPEILFHAAAHKHVPLMEENPAEAVTNNIMGTRNVLRAALASGVGYFVMISTDKAVNPTSLMGVSKRVAELLVDQAARQSGRPYVAVRFGNVLGSRGSVILTFKQQIALGGPVTVTDPEMVRYFMTIPEAVQLVLQAASLGSGGEVFVLDMGEPVRIVDLAHDLIALSGLQVGRDIDITFTGARPGEKLFEEMFSPEESYERTRHAKILTARNAKQYTPVHLDRALAILEEAAGRNDNALIRQTLQGLVPDYCPNPQPAAVAAPVIRQPKAALPSKNFATGRPVIQAGD
jgi:FlaA1/EpsC-like NDP-sugar epimerase